MPKVINLTGEKFYKLLVMHKDGKSRDGHTKWKCICDCGNSVSVIGKNLRNGNTKSCGCYNIEKIKERSFIDLSGKKFGRLIVIERGKDYTDPKSQYNFVRWICKCECGTIKTVRGIHLKNGSVVSCGCLTESYIASELKKYFTKNYNALTEYKIFKNPKTDRWLYYDIYIPDGIYIEVNGAQHYLTGHFYKNTSEDLYYQKHKDRMKRKYARQNGIYIEVDLRKIKTVEQAIAYIENKIPS